MKENFIENVPLFADLTEEERRAIGKRMRLEKYNSNETIFVKDGESDALYLIKEGWAKLSSDDGGPAVANLGPGSLLGETDFFLGQPRTTTARASGELTVWALNSEDLTDIIAERPDVGINLGLAFGLGITQYHAFLTEQLTDTPLLQDLSERERSIIAYRLSPQRYNLNDAIYRSGDAPTGLFLIEKGTVRLLGDTDDDYAELLPGEVFGEMAVISGKPHSNTAQAAGNVIVWQLSPADFNELANSYPSIKTNLSQNLRASLSASDQDYAITVLGRISLFQDLSSEALLDIAQLLLLRHVPSGELVFSQGDSGDAMYIVDSGTVEAVADSLGKPNELVDRFGDGDVFGEIALLTGKTRSYTAYAASETNLWVLYRADFDGLLIKYPQLSLALGRAVRERLTSTTVGYTNETHLTKLASLAALSRLQLDDLSARLQPRRYQAGSVIYYEGRAGAEMYFLESGQVEQWATTMQGPIMLEIQEPGDFFGEIALLTGHVYPSTAHVIIDSNIWALTQADFDDFIRRYPTLDGNLRSIFHEHLETILSRLRGSAPQRALPPAAGMMSPTPGGPSFSSVMSMPPVPVRPVGSTGQSSIGSVAPSPQPQTFHSQHTHGMPPLRPVGKIGDPGIHSQHTHGMAPVERSTEADSSVYSRHTQPFSPIRPPETAQSKETPKPKRKNDNRPRQKNSSVDMPSIDPTSPGRADSKPVGKSVRPNGKKGRKNSRPTPVVNQSALVAPSPPEQPGTAQPDRRKRRQRTGSQLVPQNNALQPVTTSNRRLQRYNSSISIWFAKRSLSAKIGISVFLILIIWLCGIAAPSFIINSLAATFEDGGALPGDDRSILNQVREDGAVGAVAVLPFIETATSTPSLTPTPTDTPTASATPTETPIPTLTHTPTNTPTPTDTPTLVFTPTPSSTPTRAFTRVPLPPTDTPTPEATPTPNVDFRLVSVRQLTPCENHGKHHIFVKVQDPSGQGINGVPVKIQWAAVEDGFIVAKTESKDNLSSQIEPGHIDFAMFKGTYSVEIQGGTSEIATGITPDYGVNEPCGEDATANSLFHQSYEVIFQRTF